MEMKIKLISIIAALTLLFGGCSSEKSETEFVISEYGNTKGNIDEYGVVCRDEEAIYFSDMVGDSYLYKIMLDDEEAEPIQLNKRWSCELNVIGDNIYYINGSPGYIYKIKTDGSGDKRIYGKRVDKMIATDKYLFFRVPSETKPAKLCRSNLNGSGVKTLVNEISDYLIDDNAVYYTDKEYSLHKIDLDGKESTLVSDVKMSEINFRDGKIYFSSADDDTLCSLSLEDKQLDVLVNEKCWNLNLCGEYIYYRNQSKRGDLYRTDFDGNVQALTYGNISTINVCGKYVFFRRITEHAAYFLLDTETRKLIRLRSCERLKTE